MLAFEEGGKTGGPGEKTLGTRTRTNNKLNQHMTPGLGTEPGPLWDKLTLDAQVKHVPKTLCLIYSLPL